MDSPTKIDRLSKLIIDLGKILFAAITVGFFIPGFSGEVDISAFIVGSSLSISMFAIGIKLTK